MASPTGGTGAAAGEPPRAQDRVFDPARLSRLLGQHGHNALLGLRSVAHGADWAELEMPFVPGLVGHDGAIGSGPIVALLDMTMSIAIWTRLMEFQPLATLDLRIDRPRAARVGRSIVGHGECYRLTPRVAFVRGHAHDGDPDEPIATVAATFMLTASV